MQNTPSLSGTLTIDGLNVSYSCASGDCQVQDVQFTRDTILFRLTCGATTYTFVGVYSVGTDGKKRFGGAVRWNNGSASRSPLAVGSGKSTASRLSVEESTWTATARS